MTELEQYRAKIDELDRQMTALFEQRMDVCKRVVQYKAQNGMEILQAGREDVVLQKARNNLKDQDYGEDIEEFYRQMMKISRGIQAREMERMGVSKEEPKPAVVGFQGVAGSFSEEALLMAFAPDQPRRNYPSFEEVFVALKSGEIDYGVLPIENSSTGSINAVYDLLMKYDFYIAQEVFVPVAQHLLALPAASMEDIREVYSHEQGFEQSRAFLAQHPDWKQIPYHNTAISAQMVSQAGDVHKAAIASGRAAELYGLKILRPTINTEKHNYTRFIIVAKALQPQADANKISMVFTLPNEPGALYGVLKEFAKGDINMLKLESRPAPGKTWEYVFYADFEVAHGLSQAQPIVQALWGQGVAAKLIGAYKKQNQ
ncbi:prephenate dehydratase [Christensenellaceae bacterium NSJ-44]|uniref:Bifunctional chorismate mutase/prephenate dehydratase n=1 Tax=Luoshenia tenuis TaxID=2763654 RepID=A0A926CZT8_9FIRM|nr:prephenate dehydratase [Luoshenia tenuis]MBC8528982.1 prephenate dehydratase [Luoshenia tenuis]